MASLVGLFVSLIYSFLPNFFCISEVSENSHQGVAGCTSLVLCYGAHVFTCGSPLFSLCFISLAALRCFERIRIVEGLFCLARANTWASAGFLQLVFFFFYASFTYLELFYLRYFSFSVFLSTGLHLWYHNVFRRMRVSQLIHLLLQLVKGFDFPSILTRSMDNFRYIFLFSLPIVFLSLL